MKSLWNDNTCTNNFIFYYLDGPYEEDDGDNNENVAPNARVNVADGNVLIDPPIVPIPKNAENIAAAIAGGDIRDPAINPDDAIVIDNITEPGNYNDWLSYIYIFIVKKNYHLTFPINK